MDEMRPGMKSNIVSDDIQPSVRPSVPSVN